MSTQRSWRRSVSLAAMVAVACSALQAATPQLEGNMAAVKGVVRDARAAVPKPRAALGQVPTSLSRAQKVRRSADELRAPDAEPQGEPQFEPWSLIAGALAMGLFVAGRRRPE